MTDGKTTRQLVGVVYQRITEYSLIERSNSLSNCFVKYPRRRHVHIFKCQGLRVGPDYVPCLLGVPRSVKPDLLLDEQSRSFPLAFLPVVAGRRRFDRRVATTADVFKGCGVATNGTLSSQSSSLTRRPWLGKKTVKVNKGYLRETDLSEQNDSVMASFWKAN